MKFDMNFAEFKEKASTLFGVEHLSQQEYDEFLFKIYSHSIPIRDEASVYMYYTFVVLKDGVYRIPFYIEECEVNGTTINLQVESVKRIADEDKQFIREMVKEMKMHIQGLECILSSAE